jgi:hypothetical protein
MRNYIPDIFVMLHVLATAVKHRRELDLRARGWQLLDYRYFASTLVGFSRGGLHSSPIFCKL